MINGVRFEQPSSFIITIGDIENRKGQKLARWHDSFSIYHADPNDQGNYHRRAVEVEKDLVDKGFGVWLDGDKKTNWRLERVPVILSYNSIELNFHTYYGYFGTNTCWCRCDTFEANNPDSNKARRRKFTTVNGKKQPTGEFEEIPCPCTHLCTPDNPEGKCFAYGRLVCQIQGWECLGSGAIYRTRGYHIINRLLTALNIMSLQLRGYIAGVPLQLQIKVVRKSDGAQTKKFPVVELVSQPLKGKTFYQVLQEAMQVPAIDSNMESRRALQSAQSNGILALMEPEEAHQIAAFIAPEVNDEPPAESKPVVAALPEDDTADVEFTPATPPPFDPLDVKKEELREAGYTDEEIRKHIESGEIPARFKKGGLGLFA